MRLYTLITAFLMVFFIGSYLLCFYLAVSIIISIIIDIRRLK